MGFCWLQRGNKTVDRLENQSLVSHDGLKGSRDVGDWEKVNLVLKSEKVDNLEIIDRGASVNHYL
jgi:hypothetical protein